MLTRLIDNQRLLAAVQAAVTALLALAVTWVGRRRAIHLEKETLIALGRAIVQVVAVGSVLLFLLNQATWSSLLALAAMILTAGFMGASRIKELPGALPVTLTSVALGAGSVIALMILVGVIPWETSSLIPVGSMIVANVMTTVVQALERFHAEIESHVGEIETALALGAKPDAAITRYVQAATEASLIPRINSLRSLGIVWIPGLMSGMVLSGEDPIFAALYQFVILAMIYAAGGFGSILSMLLMRRRVFSPAMQLLLRPGEPSPEPEAS
jgi:putative ABC transport system permease protein